MTQTVQPICLPFAHEPPILSHVTPTMVSAESGMVDSAEIEQNGECWTTGWGETKGKLTRHVSCCLGDMQSFVKLNKHFKQTVLENGPKTSYSRLSLSRPRLSRIIAYLEEKIIWSLFKHRNGISGKKKYCG